MEHLSLTLVVVGGTMVGGVLVNRTVASGERETETRAVRFTNKAAQIGPTVSVYFG